MPAYAIGDIGTGRSGLLAEQLLFLVLLLGALGTCFPANARATDDPTAVASAVGSFHDALARADATAALRLLAPDAVILENGSRETREQYRAHHLPADIEFAQVVPAHRTGMQVTVTGEVAWVSSTSTMRGSFRGKPINSTATELMVLTRTEAGWAIRAIHWSSRTAASGAR